jgi:branched-chain amino acid aminotransferase
MTDSPGRISIDGELHAPGSALVPYSDYGFLYGDGVFETLRTYGGRPFRLPAHLARLEEGLATVEIQGAPPTAELSRWFQAALDEARLPEAYCRITVTRGKSAGRLDPANCGKPTVVIAVLPLRAPAASVWRDGLHAVLLWPRARGDRPPPSVKSTSFQRTVLARLELARKKAGEGLFLDEEGHVTEGSVSNVFACFGRALITPPPDVCLRGVTRAEVLSIARAEGLAVSEEPLLPARLWEADEVFVTSSLMELAPVVRIEDRPVGGGVVGPVTLDLLQRYRERAHRVD